MDCCGAQVETGRVTKINWVFVWWCQPKQPPPSTHSMFFSETPRFADVHVCHDRIIHASHSHTTNATPRKTIPHYDLTPRKVSTTQSRPNSPSPSSLNRPTFASPTAMFGSSQRSTPLTKSVRGFVVVPRSANSPSPAGIGPGSYTDSHYRGSPDVVASLMLQNSHNARITNGNKHHAAPKTTSALAHSDDHFHRCKSAGNKNIRSSNKKRRREKQRVTAFSKPYDEFLAGEDVLMNIDDVCVVKTSATRKSKNSYATIPNPNPLSNRPHPNDLWTTSRTLNPMNPARI